MRPKKGLVPGATRAPFTHSETREISSLLKIKRMFWKKSPNGKHETWHAKQRAHERKISEIDRKQVIRYPDVVVVRGNRREHYRKSESRPGLYIKAVMAFGAGAGGTKVSIVAGMASISGIGVGIAVAILTYFYITANRVPGIQEADKKQAS